MKTNFILSLFLYALSHTLYAQEKNISGFIFNESKLPLVYVSVFVSNTPSIGTFTNEKGFFALKADISDTLFISHVGYESIKIPVNKFEKQIILKQGILYLKDFTVKTDKKPKWINEKKLGLYWKKPSISFYVKGNNNFALFLPNEMRYEGIIKKIYYKIQHKGKNKKYKNNKIQIRARVYLVNRFDSSKKDLLQENIFIQMRQNQKSLEIDLKDYNIPFLKEGLFIGLDIMGYLDEKDKLIKDSSNDCVQNIWFKMTDYSDEKHTFYKSFASEKWTSFSRLPISNQKLITLNAMFGAEIIFEEY